MNKEVHYLHQVSYYVWACRTCGHKIHFVGHHMRVLEKGLMPRVRHIITSKNADPNL